MFIAGAVVGVVGGVIVVAHDDHSDYSDYSRYSEYSDASMKDRIREKEAELANHQRMAEHLRRSLSENLAEEIEALEEDPDIREALRRMPQGTKPAEVLEKLPKKTAQLLKEKLRQEIVADEEKLQNLDRMIQRINEITLLDEN